MEGCWFGVKAREVVVDEWMRLYVGICSWHILHVFGNEDEF